jgi:uroporphyrinogen-III decarboxylase
MGRARYGESEELRPKHYDITSVEEVLSYDAQKMATNIPDMDTLTEEVRRSYENGQAAFPEAVYPGGFYQSVFTWHIQSFGWELFLEAVAVDSERFDKVMESFFGLSMMVVEAHIRAEVPYFLCHDDIVWASGSVFRPTWMRQYVFPRLKRMWAPLKEAGIKVLFCSDGNFTEYIDDIAEAGAEGFIFEPLTDLEYIVEHYGKTHVIVGNADCRVLMHDNPEEIRAEVKRCMDLGKPCPGFFMAVGNHIPYNVPVSAVECYFEAYEQMAPRA